MELVWRSCDQDGLQLVCCALVQELGCLVISGGQSEKVSGIRCRVDRET